MPVAYPIKFSFWIVPKKLGFVQRLVRQFNGRFIGNPIEVGKRALVEVGFDDVYEHNKFNARLACLDQSFV